MPVLARDIKALNAGLFMKRLAAGVTTFPTAVTVALSADAAAGATSLTVTALPAAIPTNTVLVFNAGDPDEQVVVTTADADASDTTLAVDTYLGATGDGLDAALTTGDQASWDTLLTAAGTEDIPYARNDQSTELGAATHGSGTGIRITTPQINTAAPSIAVTGIMSADNGLLQDILEYAGTNTLWAVRQVVPNADGGILYTRHGIAKLLNPSEPTPVADLMRLSYTVRFIAEPTFLWGGVAA